MFKGVTPSSPFGAPVTALLDCGRGTGRKAIGGVAADNAADDSWYAAKNQFCSMDN
jgi:hypothetical protein